MNLSAFQDAAGGIIIHGGVQAYVPNRDSGHMFFHLMEGDKEADRIVPPCAGETQEQGEAQSLCMK